ncbi:MAG: histidine kinase [Microbacterium sp.]
MKRYVDHLSRELFRFALTVTILLFLLFTAGLIVNLQFSTAGVLTDGASRLSRYWGSSIAQIEDGITRLAAEDAVSEDLLARRADATRRAAAYDLLYSEVRTWAAGSSFALIDSEGRVAASNLYEDNQLTLTDPALIAALRAAIEASEDGVARQALRVRLAPPHAGTYVMAVPVTDPDGTGDGAMMIGILGESGLIDQIRAQSIERIVVTDSFDNIYFDSGTRSRNTSAALGTGKFVHSTPGLLTLRANGVDYFHASAQDPETSATITVLTPQRFFWTFAGTSFVILGVAAVLMVILAKAITRRQSRRSARALADLDRGIDEWFRGNLGFRLATPAYREFTGVYDSFNHIVTQLDVQVKSNIALEQSHTALEMRQLETQFNPHFVFNTLEMVRYEIPTSPDTAGRIVLDLAGLMRYSIRGRGNAMRLSEDVAYLRSFLELHKLRLGTSMDFRIDCAADALEALVPRLLIQPLVENALAHARPEPGVPLLVHVRAHVDDDVLTIAVDDNGAPISEAILQEIHTTLLAEEQPAHHLGVFLVNRVITLLYGREHGYGLRIASDETGTHALVRIPYEV